MNSLASKIAKEIIESKIQLQSERIQIFFQAKDKSWHPLLKPDQFKDVDEAKKYALDNKWLGKVKIVRINEQVLSMFDSGFEA